MENGSKHDVPSPPPACGGHPSILHSPRWVIASAAFTILVHGCSSERLVIPLGAEVGTYTLATIDGKTPPVTIGQTQGGKVDVTSAFITLDANGPFLDVTDTRITTTDTSFVSSDTVRGSWVRSRNTILFSPESDELYQMELGSASLTRALSSLTWVYRR